MQEDFFFLNPIGSESDFIRVLEQVNVSGGFSCSISLSPEREMFCNISCSGVSYTLTDELS